MKEIWRYRKGKKELVVFHENKNYQIFILCLSCISRKTRFLSQFKNTFTNIKLFIIHKYCKIKLYEYAKLSGHF